MSEEKLLGRGPMGPILEKVADDVWVLRGDVRHGMNVYFLEEDGGLVQFDAGTRGMVKANRAVAERLGPIKRIVLGHAHADHRGTAAAMGVPVLCHPDEVADAESDAPIPAYMDLSLVEVAPVRWIYPTLLKHWDGGAVRIDGIVSEGDEIAGFKVIDFPGHAPGLIGLWRESDRLAIVSDTVYFVDSTRFPAAAPRRGDGPSPRLRLGPPAGQGLGPQAGGARPGDRLRRARRAGPRRQPPRDARGSRGEVLRRPSGAPGRRTAAQRIGRGVGEDGQPATRIFSVGQDLEAGGRRRRFRRGGRGGIHDFRSRRSGASPASLCRPACRRRSPGRRPRFRLQRSCHCAAERDRSRGRTPGERSSAPGRHRHRNCDRGCPPASAWPCSRKPFPAAAPATTILPRGPNLAGQRPRQTLPTRTLTMPPLSRSPGRAFRSTR